MQTKSKGGSEDQEVALVRQEASEAAQQAERVIIKDDLGLTNATDILSRIKSIAKAAKARKEEITKPLNEALSSARSLFKPIETSCEQAEGVIKGKILAYQNEQERKIEAAKVKVAERVERGTMLPETAVAKIETIGEASTAHQGNVGAIAQRVIKKYRVVDASLLPREYLAPDMAKITEALKAGVEVPGAEVYEEKIISAR